MGRKNLALSTKIFSYQFPITVGGVKVSDSLSAAKAAHTFKKVLSLLSPNDENREQYQRCLKKVRTFSKELERQGTVYEVSRIVHGEVFTGQALYRPGRSLNARVTALNQLKENIRYRRQQYKEKGAYGEVYENFGDFLRLGREKLRKQLHEHKAPYGMGGSANHIGVEIEFLAQSATEKDILDALLKAGLSKYANLGTDGSVTAEGGDCEACACGCTECDTCEGNGHTCEGWELRLLAPETKIADIVTKACAALASVGAEVNATCGLHVHLDARNRPHTRMFKNLVHSLPILSEMVPASRRENTYCKLNTSATFPKDNGERYYAVNGQSYFKHKTIEVRLHSGTVNAEKINNWIVLLINIVNGGTEFDAIELKRPSQLFKLLPELSNVVKEYVKERMQLFSAGKFNESDFSEAA